MSFFAAFLISLSHLSYDDIDNIIKTSFEEIIKEISNPLYYIFKYFIMTELRDKYTKLLSNNMRPNFLDNFNKLYYEEKLIPDLKRSEIVDIISKGLNKSIDSLKLYSNLNLKDSVIKPFGDAFNQMLHSIERKTINKFINIYLNMILFGELEINKQKMLKNLEFQNKVNIRCKIKKNPNIYEGSALFNNINDIAPYLPEMNKKYKYTLVLDMDETLVHFFFTTVNGMFFVRPYCLEFLNELNKYYEIVTFTAGIKDYADNILNLLDVNDNIIKFRLYRQHVTTNGFNSYKNLKLLGRDIKKMVIIDNLKENFALQPDNGLFIKTWTSDVNDTQFIDLLNILKNIALSNVNDIRPIIRKINDKIKYNGDLINPYSKINIKRIIEDELKIKKK
jgi:Dullard-like phosphatase family protein